MGTTTTAAILDEEAEEVAIGHVGDSRAYRLRRGKLERLTRDHSLVEEMRRKGQLTEAQAEDHPQRSIITRALGPEPEVEVDLQTVPAQAGDVFLICSDGLTTMLDDEHIERLLDPRHLDAERGPRPGRRSQPGGRPRQHQRDRLQGRRRGRTGARLGSEGATLIGASAEEAGLTATEVRRRAAADAARQRREDRPPRRPAGAAAGSQTGGRRSSPLLVVIGAIVFGATYGLHHVWFLGTDDAGRVTLYRGVPYELPFGIKLYSERYSAPVQTEALPERRKDAVTGHSVRSHADAVKLLEEIERGQGVTESAAGG